MSKQKKGGIINNFRLTLVDDDTHDKLWSRKFTRMGALVTAITTVVVTITVIFCLIAFTPIILCRKSCGQSSLPCRQNMPRWICGR